MRRASAVRVAALAWAVLMLCQPVWAGGCPPDGNGVSQAALALEQASPSLQYVLEQLGAQFGYHVVSTPELLAAEADVGAQICAPLADWLAHLLFPAGLTYRIIDSTIVVYRPDDSAQFDVGVDAGFGPVAPVVSEVFVTGHYPADASVGPVQGRHFGVGIGDAGVSINEAELKASGAQNLAAALELIPGVKVENQRYAVIRGLGGRYQSFRLNGAAIPNLSPVGQQVPLDVFPVDLLNEVRLYKTTYANRPGSATAGLVNIETRRIPEQNSLRLRLGGAYRSATTGAAVIRGEAHRDWLGFDDGSRQLPPALMAAARSGENLGALSSAQREAVGEAVPRMYGVYEGRAGLDTSFGLSGGYYWRGDERSAGVTASFGFRDYANYRELNSWVYNRSSPDEAGVAPTPVFAVEQSRHKRFEQATNSNALLSAAYAAGDDVYIGLNVLELGQSSHYTEQIESDGDMAGGSGEEWLRNVLNLTEQRLRMAQLFSHYLGGEDENLAVDWQLSRASSFYNRPYALSYRYLRSGTGSYQMQFGPDMAIEWEEINGDALSAGVELAYKWVWDDWAFEAKLGLEQVDESQEGYVLSYFFRSYGVADDRELIERNNPDDILIPEYIQGTANEKGFLFTEAARFAYNNPQLDGRFYRAEHRNAARFLLFGGKAPNGLEWLWGRRVERDNATVGFWDVQAGDVLELHRENEMLASYMLAYERNDFAGSLSYSETVVWPHMNELLPLRHEDINSRIMVIGNPYLEPTASNNWDLRGQYFGAELFPAVDGSLFYKEIDRAIEGVFDDPVTDRSFAFDSYTYANAGKAKIYGYELELDHGFAFEQGQHLKLTLSYTRLFSKVDRGAGSSSSERLQGQPNYLASLHMQYQPQSEAHRFTVFYKRIGNELYIGSKTVGVPDVYLQTRSELHLAYAWQYSEQLEFNIALRDALNSQHRYVQGNSTFLEYRSGRLFQLGLEMVF